MKIKKPILLISAIIIVIAVFLISFKDTSYEDEFFSLDTVIKIRVVGASKSTADEVFYNIRALVNEKDKLFSAYGESALSSLNKSGKTDEKELVSLLFRSISVANDTDNAFSPSLFSVTSLWNIKSLASVPSDSEIEDALKKTDHALSYIENGIFYSGGVMYDLGGIAKGHIASEIYKTLSQYDMDHAVFSVGGCVFGYSYGGRSFNFGIEDEKNGGILGSVYVSSGDFISSSSAEKRNAVLSGEKYHHILDPKTGRPSDSDIISVSVISKDGALSDALSTALYVMGYDKAAEFAENTELEFDAIIVKNNGDIFLTEGIKDNFRLE